MRSDQDHSGKTPRRNSSMPVPGMPYGYHTDTDAETPAPQHQGFDFIESSPKARQHGESGPAYNPWEEQGWEAAQPDAAAENTPPGEPYGDSCPYQSYPQETYVQEPYQDSYYASRPEMPPDDTDYESPEAYEEYPETGPYPPPDGGDGEPPQAPPPPMPPERNTEPWRLVVILCCVAGLLFCGIEIYHIAHNVVQSDAELAEYRETYLKENNVDFTRNAVAVALRPAGETYPPTATPVTKVTPTPSPRIEQNDPLIAAMSGGGLDTGQSVAPSSPTPTAVLRTTLARYPDNPLLIVSSDMETLQEDNEDIIGELTISGLMDEIVVQRNNTYYLNHNAMGVYSEYSAVFADESLSLRTPPENILLFGRASTENKAFGPLKQYVSQGFSFAQQHAFLSFNTLYEEARYVVIAVIRADASASSADYFNYRNLTFATDEAMLAYAQEAMERSLYNFNVSVAASDRLLTLVTLSEGTDTQNIILVCRKLRDGESDGMLEAN